MGPEGCTTIFVANLSWSVAEEDLWTLFGDCGTVSSIRMGMDRDTGRSKGNAHVEFEKTESVDEAVKLMGHDLMGREIRIDHSGQSAGYSGGGGGSFGGGGRGGKGGSRGGFGGKSGRGGFGKGKGKGDGFTRKEGIKDFAGKKVTL